MITVKEALANARLVQKKTVWLALNRGVLKDVAADTVYTPTRVQQVFWGRGKSRDGAIENRLAELGAPGVKRRAS